jgi:hypothetical protein
MHPIKTLLGLAIVTTGCWACAQGTFQDLDFEQAQIIGTSPGLISLSAAFPGWTLLANNVPFTINAIQLNSVLFDGARLRRFFPRPVAFALGGFSSSLDFHERQLT